MADDMGLYGRWFRYGLGNPELGEGGDESGAIPKFIGPYDALRRTLMEDVPSLVSEQRLASPEYLKKKSEIERTLDEQNRQKQAMQESARAKQKGQELLGQAMAAGISTEGLVGPHGERIVPEPPQQVMPAQAQPAPETGAAGDVSAMPRGSFSVKTGKGGEPLYVLEGKVGAEGISRGLEAGRAAGIETGPSEEEMMRGQGRAGGGGFMAGREFTKQQFMEDPWKVSSEGWVPPSFYEDATRDMEMGARAAQSKMLREDPLGIKTQFRAKADVVKEYVAPKLKAAEDEMKAGIDAVTKEKRTPQDKRRAIEQIRQQYEQKRAYYEQLELMLLGGGDIRRALSERRAAQSAMDQGLYQGE